MDARGVNGPAGVAEAGSGAVSCGVDASRLRRARMHLPARRWRQPEGFGTLHFGGWTGTSCGLNSPTLCRKSRCSRAGRPPTASEAFERKGQSRAGVERGSIEVRAAMVCAYSSPMSHRHQVSAYQLLRCLGLEGSTRRLVSRVLDGRFSTNASTPATTKSDVRFRSDGAWPRRNA